MSGNEKNRGAAMVIVLCVMVVFLALSATVILSGSVALTTARNNAIFERSKAQVVSLSELFARDMEKQDFKDEKSLQHYVRDEIVGNRWPAYDEASGNKADAVRRFTMDASEDEKHQIEIEMYWTWNGAVGDLVKEEELKDKDVYLYVEVISTLNDSEYRVKREFDLDVNENTDAATKSTYPYIWDWKTMGRSDER